MNAARRDSRREAWNEVETEGDLDIQDLESGALAPAEGVVVAGAVEMVLDAPPLAGEVLTNTYALFLGRPAPVEGASPVTNSLPALLAGIFASEEFRSEVLKPILLLDELPPERFIGSPSYRMIDWAQQNLPIDRTTAAVCGVTRSWTSLLEVLLADTRLAKLVPEWAQSGVTTILRERIDRDPKYAARCSVVGAIDTASAFEVRGWAADLCNKNQTVTLELYADTAFIGATRSDLPRPDVADIVGGTGLVGFVFRISPAHRAAFVHGANLTAIDSISRQPISAGVMVYGEPARNVDGIADARREIQQLRKALERIEAQLPQLHQLASMPLEAYGEYWERFYRPTPDVLERQRATNGRFAYRPLASVVVPTFECDGQLLDKALRSVLAQSYENWEIIVCDDASPDVSEWELVKRRYGGEQRIRWLRDEVRAGIVGNTNRALAEARGDYVAFLNPDDELAPDALHRSVAALQEQRYALMYSDEDRIEQDEYGQFLHHTPCFKPDFDPDLLLSTNYIGHLVVVSRAVLSAMQGLRTGFDGAQDHDLLLRLSMDLPPDQVHHIPRVLYHRRVPGQAVPLTANQQEGMRRAVVAVAEAHLRERGVDAVVEPHSDPVGQSRLLANRVRWRLPSAPPKVSILIPTRDRRDLLEPCVESLLRAAPAYPGVLEIMVIDNESSEAFALSYLRRLASISGVRVLRHSGKFNWSAINNAAAREAVGEVLIFLNNDTVVLTPDWCNELVANALRPEVGAVGARLLYQDGTIQHTGMLIGVEGIAGHESVGEPASAGGYLGRNQLLRDATAVTGACLATRRDVFMRPGGGFDELELQLAFNDIDYCLQLRAEGFRVVYTPYAVLYHLESKTRGQEQTPEKQARHRAEALAFRTRWADHVQDDPYYNPHFERFARPFERLRHPPD